ncbi:hypothetical protein VTN77DRAFT_5678 [Rasamsonia byssochlamydoides]|uniref:uncharacterized protein n=1 Tax=Rasamsonia byssochlamydoides TaxID=89139 RepID=UPI003742E4F2
MPDSKPRHHQKKQRASTSAAIPGNHEPKQQSIRTHDLTRPTTAKSSNIRKQTRRKTSSERHIEGENRSKSLPFSSQKKENSGRMDSRSKKTGLQPSKSMTSGQRTRTRRKLVETDHKHTDGTPLASSRKQPTKSGRSDLHRNASQDVRSSIVNPTQNHNQGKHHVSRPSAISAKKSSADKIQGIASPNKGSRKSAGFLSLVFGAPDHPRPEKRITCITCLSDDIPISKSAKLACSHRMCHSCLKRIFVMSVTDPQHMPPRCCTSDHIPLKHVEKLFDVKFKMKWNRKYQEYTTKNRIYCPAKGCGEWIKPNQIFLDTSSGPTGGRKYGKCSRCNTKVCCICNGKWHSGKDCPKDEETKKFVDMAKEKGWQRCYNCSAMVELKEGCNHMTCRCTAEFCMICGSKWKTCDCPWFNYGTGEGDRLNYMNVPQIIGAFDDGDGGGPRNRLRYQDELDRRREQEQQDEALARRLQLLAMDDDDRPPGQGILDFGNAMPHFLNEHFNYTPNVTGNAGSAYRGGQATAAHEIRGFRANTPSPPPDRSRPSRRNRNRQQSFTAAGSLFDISASRIQ